MPYGAGNHQINPERQRQYLEQIAAHKEVHPDMLLGVLGLEQTVQLDAYQSAADDKTLLASPLPPEFAAKDDKTAKIAASIENNTALYDDLIEDLIDQDPVIVRLMTLPADEERTRAMRARRTIFTLALKFLDSEPSEDVGNIDEGAA